MATDSLIRSNDAEENVIVVRGAELVLRNTDLINNNDAAIFVDQGQLELADCKVSGNRYRGVNIIDSEALIQGCTIERNGGGLAVSTGADVIVEETDIHANSSMAIGVSNARRFVMRHCTVRGNRSFEPIVMRRPDNVPPPVYTPHVILRNCLIYDNVSTSGTVMQVRSCEFEMYQCSVFGNWSVTDDAALSISAEGKTRIRNSIVWENNPSDIFAEVPEELSVAYSNIGGSWPGIGNIDANPRLIHDLDWAGVMRRGSPCIDAGDPATTDDLWDRHPRWPDWAPNGPTWERSAARATGAGCGFGTDRDAQPHRCPS